MKRLIALGLVVAGFSFARGEEPLASPAQDAEKAKELVKSLGDPRFRVRDSAARDLMKLGRFAKPALLEGMKSADPEVWNRCAQLLPEVLAADLKARVDAFLADTEGKQKHELPLMELYQKLAGNDAAARKLYAEMVKSSALFLDACEVDPKRAGEKYTVKAQEMFQQLNMPQATGNVAVSPRCKIHDLAALFLVGADDEMAKGIKFPNGFNPVANFFWQQEFQNSLRAGETAPPFRKLFFSWAEHNTDVNSVSQVLSVVQNINLKEGLDYAVKVMKLKDQQVWTRAQAMTCVGKMGGKEHVAAFEAMFDDKTAITNIQLNNLQISTQVSDIALAMAVHLRGQQPKDFGFEALQSQPALLWSFHYLGFTSDENRGAAFKKYKDMTAPKESAPAPPEKTP